MTRPEPLKGKIENMYGFNVIRIENIKSAVEWLKIAVNRTHAITKEEIQQLIDGAFEDVIENKGDEK